MMLFVFLYEEQAKSENLTEKEKASLAYIFPLLEKNVGTGATTREKSDNHNFIFHFLKTF